MAALTFPASTFAFGDTYDTPRMTVGIGFAGCTWNGTSTSSLRHTGGMFNFSFVDGHAKSVKMQAGMMTGAFNNRMVIVASQQLGETAYCSDPDAIINKNPTSDDSMSIPDGIRCGDIVKYIYSHFGKCPTGGGGTDCFFSN